MRQFFIVFILLFCTITDAAIFGSDDRFSVTASHAKNKLAQATAVGVLSSMIEPTLSDASTYTLSYSTLDEFLCSDQKFVKLPSVDYACSGFLIAPDILVTAGHCSVNVGDTKNEKEMYCESYRWLFGYQVEANGKVTTEKIPADHYYQCKEIIYAINDDKDGITYDYAVIRLDRPVVGREPLKVSTTPAKIGEAVSMIGYPLGVPMVYTGNARVTAINPLGDSVITTLDAFDGNSGSPVMNSKNEVIGLLIAGTPESFVSVPNPKGGSCTKYNKCDANGKNCLSSDGILDGLIPIGSEVQNIQPVLEILKTL